MGSDDPTAVKEQRKALRVIYFRTEGGTYPARDWLGKIDREARAKFLKLLSILEELGPAALKDYGRFFESLDRGLYQVKFLQRDTWYRLIFFYGPRTVVISHGFEKKTNKTPKREIDTALEHKKLFEQRLLTERGQTSARARKQVAPAKKADKKRK